MHTQSVPSLEDILPVTHRVQLAEIAKAVCGVYEISRLEFVSSRRFKKFVEARHVYFWVARKFTTCSLPMIGRFCGNRDHSTVMHGARKVDLQFPMFRDRIANVLEALQLDTEVAA